MQIWCSTCQVLQEELTTESENWQEAVGPGQNKINMIGSVSATLAVGDTSPEQELYVVDDLKESFLGGKAFNWGTETDWKSRQKW